MPEAMYCCDIDFIPVDIQTSEGSVEEAMSARYSICNDIRVSDYG